MLQKKGKRPPTRTAWPKGVSGNPKGRPRVGNTIAELTRELLEKPAGKTTDREEIISKAIALAKDGSLGHAEFLFNRAYGKPREVIEPLIPDTPSDPKEAAFLLLVEKDVEIRTKYLAILKENDKR
jgi:hypothetical protein